MDSNILFLRHLPVSSLFCAFMCLGLLSIVSVSTLSANDVPINLSSPASLKSQLASFNQLDFLGSEACQQCHLDEYQTWLQSTHAKAGGHATPQRVIPEFKGELQFRDALVRLVKKDGKYAFSVKVAEDRTYHFQVDAVVGGGYIKGGAAQSFFSTLEDGTLRYLPFDYSVDLDAWFCQTNKGWLLINEQLTLNQCLSWPPNLVMGQHVNFDRGCLDCHGSQIQLSFDSQAERYRTSYTSLHINCESCHGPGKRHVDLARAGRLEQGGESGMRDLAALDKWRSVNVCMQCHGKKTPIGRHTLSDDFEEGYSLFTSLHRTNSELTPTGRIREFSYQESHRFSACFLSGTLTCTNCHSPHGLNYRDIAGTRLNDAWDNRQCTSCHAEQVEDTQKHSRHPAGSAGDKCTACHMPSLQQPGVGEHVPYARADHSISIPRPGLERRLGVTNACGLCHQNKTPQELEAILDEWYGKRKPLSPTIQTLIRAQERGVIAKELLEKGSDSSPAQLASLDLFIQRYLSPNMVSLPNDWLVRLKELTQSKEIDLKAAALSALHLTQGDDLKVRLFLKESLDDLKENEIAVRRRWVYMLNEIGDLYTLKGDTDNARLCYEKMLELEPNHARALTNLGSAAGKVGELEKAIDLLRRAKAADPDYAAAYINLGIALIRQGHDEQGKDEHRQGQLRRGLQTLPE